MSHQPHSTQPDQARCFETMPIFTVVTDGHVNEFDEIRQAIIDGRIGNDI